jgi:N-acyl-D-aspartate/D-glutamate deacylase
VADLVIGGALIVDGSGSSPRPGTLVVSGDRIEDVLGPEEREPGSPRRIDGSERVVAPGFVDVHSHSDLTPLVEPTMDSMLRQGVTTLVVGNCGGSAYPVAGAADMAALAGADPSELALDWRSFGEYLERVDRARPALNVAALVGHGTLRTTVMGHDQRRAPGQDELRAMRELLREALREGAVGLSSGLVYAPGLHATTDELASLASALSDEGGIYASHIRGEGGSVFDAVAECAEIGRRSGVPSHVSHLKVETRPMWGRADELLGLLDGERDRGADVTADQYPYTAWETELSSALPPWVTPAELPEVLTDPVTRERLAAAIERGEPGWENVGRGIGWDRLVIGSHLPDPSLTGRSVAQLAEDVSLEPSELIARLLIADPYTGLLGHAMHEDDVRTILARRDVFVATDGLAISPDGPLGAFAIHPRYYGTFPRVLGRYAREEGILSLPDAVRKMSLLPAERFRLARRGRIEPGAFADLVVFDPGRIADRATYERPHAFADGVDVVVVNGRVAWDGSVVARHGRALRRDQA